MHDAPFDREYFEWEFSMRRLGWTILAVAYSRDAEASEPVVAGPLGLMKPTLALLATQSIKFKQVCDGDTEGQPEGLLDDSFTRGQVILL